MDAHTTALFEIIRAQHIGRSAFEARMESRRIKSEIFARRLTATPQVHIGETVFPTWDGPANRGG